MLPTTGSSEFDKAALQVGAKVITGILEHSLGKLGRMKEWLWTRYSASDPFGEIGRKIAESIVHRYDEMRILGMSEPASVRALYVRVNVLKGRSAIRRATVEDLECAFDRDRNGFGERVSTEDGVEVVDVEKRLIVLGKPGAGKTTFLKWLALSATCGRLKNGKLPVFVSLKLWADSGKSLFDFMADDFALMGVENEVTLLEEMLQSGNVLVLLDGLDEIGAATDRAAVEVQRLADKYPKIGIVISCRLAAFDYVLQSFKEVEIADFTPDQIKLFIEKWFGSDTEAAQQCWAELSHPKSRSIMNLCSTPLLLTLLCLAFQGSDSFPQNRAQLYKDALDVLLTKWDKSRQIRRTRTYKEMDVPKRELMLSRIAYNSFKENCYFLRQDVLEREIAAFVENLKRPERDPLEIESETVLKEIESQHGLLVERAWRIYSFSHLTMQEFFTAKFITENTNKTFGPTQLLDQHFGDPRWNVVIALTAGLLAEGDEYLLEIRRRTARMVNSPRIFDFLNGVDEHIAGRSTLPPAVARAMGVAHIMQTLAREYSGFQAASESATLILEDLQRAYKEDIQTTSASRQMLQLDTAPGAWTVDRLSNAVVGLPHADVLGLTDYIRGTRLVLEALSIDGYVLRKTRQRIKASVFLEPWGSDDTRVDNDPDGGVPCG